MVRVAFTMIGGREWTGGYNYLLNLVRVLASHHPGELTPVLFFGTDVDEADAAPFAAVPGAEVVRTPLMNASRKASSLAQSVLTGSDRAIRELFRQRRIDVVFEAAQFFGARLGIPAIAWIPDFQHRMLPHLFTFAGYWKREIGFRAQVAAGRQIMLSSEDSRRTCERLYPAARGRAHTVRFAIPAGPPPRAEAARGVADQYGLPQGYVFLPNQFWKHKNHLLVVEALALLRASGHRITVAASGKQVDPRDPQHFGNVRAAVAANGLQDDFRFLGLLPYEHLAPLAFASMALLNPSLFEGWSTTVEEARSLGVPMVLSDIPVHREQAGDEAVYFDPQDAASLADALRKLRPEPAEIKSRRAETASLDSVRRVKGFADSFLALAEQAAGHSSV